MRILSFVVVSIAVCGCASASPSGSSDAATQDKLTWTFVYATYFDKGTPGHCGDEGCHATSRAGYVCSSQAACYASLTSNNAFVGGFLVDPKNPSASILVDPANSPLIWFNETHGTMPKSALAPNPDAKRDVAAWISAGAPND